MELTPEIFEQLKADLAKTNTAFLPVILTLFTDLPPQQHQSFRRKEKTNIHARKILTE
jgi:hypothetical protein